MNREREKEGFNDKKERIVEVKIEDMSREGQGIGRAGGLVVFVPGAVAGDVVRAALTKVKKNYAFSRLLEIIERSPWRGQSDFAALEGENQKGIAEGAGRSFAEEGSEPLAEQSNEPFAEQGSERLVEQSSGPFAEEGGEQLVDLYGKSSVESLCASFADGCGGCPYGGLVYEAQLLIKERQVRETLQRLAGIDDPVVRPIIGMSAEDNEGFGPYRYRNKAQFPVSTGGIITRKGGIVENLGDPMVGFYRAKSHEVVDCEDCYLQSMAAMAVADALRAFMEEDNITAWDPKWGKGLIRHLIVKTAFATKEVMVILVINGKGIPNGQKLVAMLDEAIYEAGYSLESVVLNINKGGGAAGNGRFVRTGGISRIDGRNDSATRNYRTAKGNGTGLNGEKKANRRNGRGQVPLSAASGGMGRHSFSAALGGEVMGDENIVLAGKPVIRDMIGDLAFEISPASFYQVNPAQTKRLYDKVREYCGFGGGKKSLERERGTSAGNRGDLGSEKGNSAEAKRNLEGERSASAGMKENLGSGETNLRSAREKVKLEGNQERLAEEKERLEGGEYRLDVYGGRKPVILDLYCGVGSIGLFCADQAEMVIGIERVKEAVLDANRNAVINGIVNARYLCGKAEEILPAYAGYGGRQESGVVAGDSRQIGKDAAEKAGLKIDAELAAFVQRADIAVLDPPRAGCKPELLEAVAATGVNRIVYVSCDPATLARDIKLLGGMGYEFVEATPVDMFPGTSNIEVTCLLSKFHTD